MCLRWLWAINCRADGTQRCTPAVDPRELVLLRWREVREGLLLKPDSILPVLPIFAWLGAATFPDKTENRHRAAVYGQFPVITELRAGIPFSRNSTGREARPVRDHPPMFCALLWRDHRQQRLWTRLEHTTRRGVSARAQNRGIGAKYRCTFRLPVLFDRAAHQARPGP